MAVSMKGVSLPVTQATKPVRKGWTIDRQFWLENVALPSPDPLIT